MCGAKQSSNQYQCENSYKHKQKYKTARERKREHRKFVYPVRSHTDLVWGREKPSVPL